MRNVDEKTPHESSWAPLWWAMKLLTRARDSGKIKIEPPVFANLQSTFLDIEEAHRKLLSYGWVNFPLAYTQVGFLVLGFLILAFQLKNRLDLYRYHN